MAEVLALIDYGAGNLHSVHNALKAAGAEVTVTADPFVVRAADRIVLPGVGSFKACAEGLNAIPHMVEAMTERVHVGGAPFLGICVGMQLLATSGVEHGVTPGLGWSADYVALYNEAGGTIDMQGWVTLTNNTGTTFHKADTVLVAGKGHETGQIIKGDVYPFDDVEQASVAVAALDGLI